MIINLITRHFDPSVDLVELARRRAGFAFARFGDLVRAIDIRLSDVNGPRGGLGISCLARVQLARGRVLVAESAATSPEAGISQVVDRLAGQLRRLASRQQHRH